MFTNNDFWTILSAAIFANLHIHCISYTLLIICYISNSNKNGFRDYHPKVEMEKTQLSLVNSCISILPNFTKNKHTIYN